MCVACWLHCLATQGLDKLTKLTDLTLFSNHIREIDGVFA